MSEVVLAIIPARGGSKGIPRKNLVNLAGKPLIAYSIEAAQKSARLDRVIVSTDDSEIAEFARSMDCEVMMRAEGLALDQTPTLPVIQDVVRRVNEQGYKPTAIMTLQPTSPLRTAEHIDEAISLFAENLEADSLVSVVDVPHIFHPISVMKETTEGYLEPYIDGPLVTRRQEKTPVFARNGAAIYLTRISKIEEFIFGGKLIAYHMCEEESHDIDTIDDLQKVEEIITSLKNNA